MATRSAKLPARLQSVAQHAATQQASSEWLAVAVLILMVVPAGPNHVLIPMLAVTVAVGSFALLGATRQQQQLRSAILLFAAAGGVLAVHGFVRSNDGSVDVTIALVAGPVAWFLMAHAGTDWFARRVVDIAALATVIIALMVCALNFGVGDGVVRWIEPSAFGARTLGRTRTNFVGLTTMIATVPIVVSSVLDRVIGGVRIPRFGLHVTALLFSLPAVLLSGRQALTGAIALLPVLLFVRYLLGFNNRDLAARRDLVAEAPDRRIATMSRPVLAAGCAVATIVGFGAIVALDLSPVEIVQDLLASVGIGETDLGRVTYSADVRSTQSGSLWRGFVDRPIFGHGAGAISDEFGTWRGFANADGTVVFNGDFEPRPWRAELSYHLLLFEGGIVGLGLYAVAAAWSSLKVLTVYRQADPVLRSILRATIVGALSMMVGSAFNPHLRAVGAQVLLFLPILVAAGAKQPRKASEQSYEASSAG